MRPPQRVVQKKLDYPEETPGSRLAAKARKLANKLTPEQRRAHSDKHLLNIDEDALLLAFNEADLSPVRPVHPKRLLRVLR